MARASWCTLLILGGGLLVSGEEACGGDLVTCLKARLAGVLARAVRAPDLELLPGLRLVADGPPPQDLSPDLPRAALDQEAYLDQLILHRIAAFFKTHSLQFKLAEIPDSLGIEEGRGKKKRGAHTLLMMMFMMASMMLPLKMGTLAMLAGKALIISKLALALAAIVGLKKLLGNDEHQDSYQVVQVPAHGHRKRSTDYLDLPYRAYAPAS